MNQKDYKQYVILGKKELGQIEGFQKRICKYALEVITIRHGGISNGIITIKQYAEDIGMNAKTLQNWIQVYNNVIIKLEDPEGANFNKASKVNNILDEARTIDNAVNGTPNTRKAYKKNVPADRVRSLYNAYEFEKPFEGEFMNILQQIKSHKTLLGKRDLNIISDAQMQHLLDQINICAQIISDHLKFKRSAKGRTA